MNRQYACFHRFFVIILFLLSTVTVESAYSQDHSSAKSTDTPVVQQRPKVGLVLSGGGARGLAHIGVLQWFEENHIPVDYIAGTSMGGLVGAMYASGMSAPEMRAFVEKIDWEKVLSGPPSFDELTFRRKEDQRRYPTEIELGARHGVHFSSGINPGQQIGYIFDRISLPYSTIKSFDDLPIPFRCVATDMTSAESLVFKDGSLAIALRATMAVPGIFTPVEVDGRILADGGLLNNIPTDVVKDMGADIIIAINVGTPLGTRKNLETLGGMLSQVIGVTTVGSDRRNLKLADYVITPELGRYTAADFTGSTKISDLGYNSAVAQGDPLRKLSLDQPAWEAHLAARRARIRTKVPVPDALEVVGVDGRKADDIERDLQDDVGQPLRTGELERQLSEIRGGGRYNSLGYDITQLDREPRLRIRVSEKTLSPPFIIPVFQLVSTGITDLDLAAGFRLVNFDVGSYGSEVRTDVLIGTRNLFAVEYYRPVGKKGFFIAPRAYYSANRVGLFTNGDRVADYKARSGAGAVDVGFIFNRRTEVRVGYELGRDNAKVDIGDPLLPTVKGTFSDASIRFVYDGQDSAIIPTRGLRLTAESSWYFKSPGAPQGFPQSSANGSYFKRVSPKGLIFGFGGAGTSYNKRPGPVQQFTLGGPFRLSAYGRDEFRGDRFGLIGGGYLHRVGYLPPLLGQKIYLGGWYEGGAAYFRNTNANFLNDVAGAFVMETILGPVTIGGAWGEGGRGKVYFAIGRWF